MRLLSSFLHQSKLNRKLFNISSSSSKYFNKSPFIQLICGVSHFSSNSNSKPPEEFYDEEVEKDKELFDIYEVRQKGRSFENLTTNKVCLLSIYFNLYYINSFYKLYIYLYF